MAAIPGNEEVGLIDERIEGLTKKEISLSLFKSKERKTIKEEIKQANSEKKAIEDRMDAERRVIAGKINDVKNNILGLIEPLQKRVDQIIDELTKDRN